MRRAARARRLGGLPGAPCSVAADGALRAQYDTSLMVLDEVVTMREDGGEAAFQWVLGRVV